MNNTRSSKRKKNSDMANKENENPQNNVILKNSNKNNFDYLKIEIEEKSKNENKIFCNSEKNLDLNSKENSTNIPKEDFEDEFKGKKESVLILKFNFMFFSIFV